MFYKQSSKSANNIEHAFKPISVALFIGLTLMINPVAARAKLTSEISHTPPAVPNTPPTGGKTLPGGGFSI